MDQNKLFWRGREWEIEEIDTFERQEGSYYLGVWVKCDDEDE